MSRRLHDRIGHVDPVEVIEDKHLRIGWRSIRASGDAAFVLGSICRIALVDELDADLPHDHRTLCRGRRPISRNHLTILPGIDFRLGGISVDIVQTNGVAQFIGRPTHPVRLGRRPDRRVGTDQRHPIVHPVSPERSMHRPGRPDPQAAVALRRGPGAIGLVYHIKIADTGITALLQEVADHLRTLFNAVFIHRFSLHIHKTAAPVSENHRNGAFRTITQNHVQVLHIRCGIKLAIGQIRADSSHNPHDPRRKIIESRLQPEPIRSREMSVVVMDIIGVPLHAASDISLVKDPAVQHQRTLPDRKGGLRQRSVIGIRTGCRQRQRNGKTPQPTETKVHRTFHIFGIYRTFHIFGISSIYANLGNDPPLRLLLFCQKPILFGLLAPKRVRKNKKVQSSVGISYFSSHPNSYLCLKTNSGL